jgi:hypothetical protein
VAIEIRCRCNCSALVSPVVAKPGARGSRELDTPAATTAVLCSLLLLSPSDASYSALLSLVPAPGCTQLVSSSSTSSAPSSSSSSSHSRQLSQTAEVAIARRRVVAGAARPQPERALRGDASSSAAAQTHAIHQTPEVVCGVCVSIPGTPLVMAPPALPEGHEWNPHRPAIVHCCRQQDQQPASQAAGQSTASRPAPSSSTRRPRAHSQQPPATTQIQTASPKAVKRSDAGHGGRRHTATASHTALAGSLSLSRRKLLHAPVNCKFSTQRLARSWDVEVGAIKVCLADVQVVVDGDGWPRCVPAPITSRNQKFTSGRNAGISGCVGGWMQY